MHITVKNLYVLLAREVSTDAVDNMNSIVKIIDKFTFGINMEQFAQAQNQAGNDPVALPANYSVATSWLFDRKLEKEVFLNFKISIIDPKGKNLGGPEQENVIPAGLNKINMNFNMQGVPITEKGAYILRAEVDAKDGKALAKNDYPFEVEIVDQPSPVK